MKIPTAYHYFRLVCLLIFSVLLIQVDVNGQETAEEWFQKGVTAVESGVKISSYKKAIEINPFFVEAYYNLGLVYKRQGQFQPAEESFRLALGASPENLKLPMRLQILYELGITYKKLNRLDEAKTTLVEANNLATNPSLRATIWYEIGIISVIQKQFDDALIQLNEGKKEDPNKVTQFEQAINLARARKSAETYYQQGLSLIRQQKNSEALNAFRQVLKFDPKYEDVQAQIVRLEQAPAVKREEPKPNPEETYNQGLAALKDNKFDAAINLLQRVQQINPDYKDVKNQLKLAQEQQQKALLAPELEQNYNRGMQALRRRDHIEALLAFEKVRALDPNYKNINWVITQAKRGLQSTVESTSQPSQDNVIKKYYDTGLKAFNDQQWSDAISAFEVVIQMNRRYRDTQQKLTQAQEKLREATVAKESQVEKEFKDREAQLYYDQGMLNIQRQDWMQAIIALEKAKVLNPELPDLQNQINLAQQKMNAPATPATTTRRTIGSSWSVLLIVLGLGLLFVLALLYFMPSARARLYLIRGKYDKARPIYESQLTTRPGDPRLYITLANIYLLENRKDESAIRIYEAVIRMNLNTQRNDDIKNILREYYQRRKNNAPLTTDVVEEALNPTLNQIKNQ
ncbi:tetratricopeptide repeat protein [candidate division KSB1 bacterium]|nr:tetratricopeptide repeat protein [candidate division KSB1 bacterium]